jgi:PTH1 family peptidyl-tRNA hydrolase
MDKYLIVGLGNIGAEYAQTRHNIGFDVLDLFADRHKVLFQSDRLADTTRFRVKNKQAICIKPTTYMNLSGKAVKYWLEKESIPVSNLLVVVDELALPLDKIRLRGAGSAAGHNGLKSIEEALHTDVYARLRFGIGNQFPKGMQADFVLSKWTEAELPLVRKKALVSVEVIEQFILAGLQHSMNMYNKMIFTL